MTASYQRHPASSRATATLAITDPSHGVVGRLRPIRSRVGDDAVYNRRYRRSATWGTTAACRPGKPSGRAATCVSTSTSPSSGQTLSASSRQDAEPRHR